MSRISLLLDYPFTELYGEGWGKGKESSYINFAQRDNDNVLRARSGAPKNFWRVPGLGVITLEPRYLSEGTVLYDDPASDVYKSTEVDIATNISGQPALRLLEKTGTLARTRASISDATVGLFVDAAKAAILAAFSDQLNVIWRTKVALAANEGFGITFRPVRTFDDPRSRGYTALLFGTKFMLGIDLQGTVVLNENLGSSEDPNWVERKTIDVGNSISLTSDFTVMCIPIGGRYLVFRIGNIRRRAKGMRLVATGEEQDFIFDTVEEGSGNYYDAGLDQYVCLPPGKFEVAVNVSGVDYRLLPFRVRYRDDQVYFCRFLGMPLPNPVPGQTPVLTPYGYASGFTSGGAGVMNLYLEDEDGGSWTDTSKVVCPRLGMGAETGGVYTPELWYFDAQVNPVTYVPPYEADDASEDWTYIRFQRTTEMESARAEFKLNDESRASKLMRRGGPVRIEIDGEPVWDGYIDTRRPTGNQKFLETELEASDMISRLSVPCGYFESLDGKSVGETIARLLRRAGFTDPEIQVENSNLEGLIFEEFSKPQDLKVYNSGTKIREAIEDIVSHISIQGIEQIRVRWDGSKWRVYLAPNGASGDDPVTVFSAVSAALPVAPDEDRWALNAYKITSGLEWLIKLPPYNALTVSGVTGSDATQSLIPVFIAPRDEVLNDPTSQIFEGRRRPEEKSSPEVTATTQDGLVKQARYKYEYDMRRVVNVNAQAEWQRPVDVDQECAIVGLYPGTDDVVSYGVFRIEFIDVEIDRDELPDSEELLRSYGWSGSYRFQWLRPTTAEFAPFGEAIPMYDGIIPPETYLRA